MMDSFFSKIVFLMSNPVALKKDKIFKIIITI